MCSLLFGDSPALASTNGEQPAPARITSLVGEARLRRLVMPVPDEHTHQQYIVGVDEHLRCDQLGRLCCTSWLRSVAIRGGLVCGGAAPRNEQPRRYEPTLFGWFAPAG
ncbi:hypothetical protein CCHOA_11400 [Corynebacterium choanae]|uniref:Uncharacterized protein n=1 Tax=Corynebacterium choanae TaxID=1862358 RepID=A0A3G6J958_9CORY|nr:hypothetical protein CCHOA_11400 [Corynebacterium choanae]